MDLEFIKLVDWFKLYGGGGRLIDASSLPSDMDLDLTDWDGREVELARILKKIKMPRQRSYYLGSVTTGVFGMQSSANHRIVRGKRGVIWKMYVSGPDFPEGELSMGVISSKKILGEVEDLGYHVYLRQWIAMGWRPNC